MALLGNGNNSYLENLNMGALDITPMVFLLLNGLTDLYDRDWETKLMRYFTSLVIAFQPL